MRADQQTSPLAAVPPDADVLEVHEVWSNPDAAWSQFTHWHSEVRERFRERRNLEKHDIGQINGRIEKARLEIRRQEIDHHVHILNAADEMLRVEDEMDALQVARKESDRIVAELKKRFGTNANLLALATQFATAARQESEQQAEQPRQRLAELQREVAATPEPVRDAVQHYLQVTRACREETQAVVAKIEAINRENARYELRMATAQGQEQTLSLGDIVRAYPANQLGTAGKLSVYLSRWTEFLRDDPREANSEGGVFPAIWGTIAMTLLMALVVVPFGVLAALYLREYAKAGPIVSAVRISINNLAGVPSIVFGVFGMGFFCYLVGAYIDGGPANANLPVWPGAKWFGTLLALAVVGVVAFLLSLYRMAGHQPGVTTAARRYTGYAAIFAWLVSLALFVVILATTPFFSGWYETNLPNPKFGKGGLIWASLTLALLTLPVVIVATEEALSAVPNSLREGSYACGAGKWQTIRRIVLPHALPGIMTGMILAMARGAGEVAPLMLVGAVKLAPELPVDFTNWSGAFGPVPTGPLHADRSFMHLGFHVFDLGFQSQNSEAAKPMVYTTTLLLIVIIALLNVFAVWLRSRLRRRFGNSAF
jgi:ABC-type phosphate transport system permease subunit